MRARYERYDKHGKKRRLILFSLLGVALVVSILLASFFLFTPEKPSATARLSSARTDTITGKAGGEGSEEYNQKLKEHDTRQANEALKAGESFVPTPVGQRKLVVGKKEDTPPGPAAGRAGANRARPDAAHGQYHAETHDG